LSNGYYIYSGNLSDVASQTLSFSINPNSTNMTIKQGSSCELTGSVTTNNYPITVKGYLDGNPNPYAIGTASYGKPLNLGNIGTNGFNSFKAGAFSVGTHTIDILAFDSYGMLKGQKQIIINVGAGSVSSPTIKVEDSVEGKTATITQNASGATLYYTVNGKQYSLSSPTQPKSIPITEIGTTKITAWSVKGSYKSSTVEKLVSVSKLNVPEIDYSLNSTGATVTITSAVSSEITYSLNGNDWTKYTGSLAITENTSIRAKVSRKGYIDSEISTKEIMLSAPKAPLVSIDNASSHIAKGDSIAISWTKDNLAAEYKIVAYKDGECLGESDRQQEAQLVECVDEPGVYKIEVIAYNPFGETKSSNAVTFTVHDDVKVTFADYDGTVISEQIIKYGYDAQQPESAPSRRGYTFSGWKNSFYAVKSDVTVVAKYQINSYRINYYDANQKFLTSETVEFEKSANTGIAESLVKLKTGYVLKGWYVQNATEDSERNINSVDSDMDLIAVSEWEDPDYRFVVTEPTATSHYDSTQGVSTGYDVSFKLTISPTEEPEEEPEEETEEEPEDELAVGDGDLGVKLPSTKAASNLSAKVVISAFSADNKMLATAVKTISAYSDTTDEEESIFVSYDSDIAVARIEINMFSIEGQDRTGGCIAKAASCTPLPSENDAGWSAWADELPAGVATATQSKKVYRYRNNTKSTVTSESDTAPAGYTLDKEETYWDSEWIGPLDTAVTESDTKQVKTEQVVATYKTQYQYYRYVCNANSSHGWYGYGCSCASYMNTSGSGCSGTIVSNLATTWSDIPYTTAKGWSNATSDGLVKYKNINGIYWYYHTTNTGLHATRKVAATYKNQYYYKDLHTNYVYYKWENGAWSDWSDEAIEASADGSLEVEEKTVYRYVKEVNNGNGGGTEFSISYDNSLVNAANDTLATVLVYKSKNTDPTESQLEYVKQTTVGELNGFRFVAKEDPSISSGDYVVSVAVKGYDGLINIDTIEAPKPEYKVTFLSEDGTVISEQTVTEGGAATTPNAPEKEGYLFAGWNKATTNIYGNISVMPIYVARPYAVAYVDYLNQTCEIETFYAGDALTVPETVPEHEGYEFLGWDGIEEGAVVTENIVIKAEWEAKSYTVTFYNADDSVLDTQTVEYGDAATLPSQERFVAGDKIFLGWDTSVEWWNVTADIDVHPLMIYAESAKAPVANVDNYVKGDSVTVTFENDEEGGKIYYTLDGSDPNPDKVSTTVDEDEIEGMTYEYNSEDPIVREDSTNIKAVTVVDGKNVSEIVNICFEYSQSIDETYTEVVEIATYNVIASPGKEVEIKVDLQNNPGLEGYLFQVECDRTAYMLACDEGGMYQYSAGSSFTSGTTMCADYRDSGWQIFWFGTEAAEGDGNVFTIKLLMAEDVEDGKTYPITVSYSPENTITKDESEMTLSQIVTSLVTEEGTLLGDVNGDGAITTVDLIRIAKHVLGTKTLSNKQQKVADVTGDGKITNADVIRVAKYIIGAATLG